MRTKIKMVMVVMGGLLFAALNQTVIGAITPQIVADLGHLENLTWVFTLFMLASTVATALTGRLSDIYGRKSLLLTGLTLLMLGSLLCGFAQSILVLSLFRGIQGAGVGIIITISFTIVGDLFVPLERGRWLGIVTSVYGVASIFGPVLGGYIADHAAWRWAFWVFLPFGAVAMVFVWLLFPSPRRIASRTVDYLGALWLTMALASLLFAFSLGGIYFAWDSILIIGLFGASLICSSLFIRAEKKAVYPIMPIHLFKNRTFAFSNLIGLASSIGMFGTITYAPLFIQGVLGTSAAMSGALIIPLTLSLVAANAAAGWFVSRMGHYKRLVLIGLAVMFIGMLFLSRMGVGTSIPEVVLFIAIFGLGLGVVLSVFTLITQNAVDDNMLSAATASFQLFRQLGATIGLSIMGTIINQRLEPSSYEAFSPSSRVENLSYALKGVFQFGLYAAGLAFILGLLIIEIPLRSAEYKTNQKGEAL